MRAHKQPRRTLHLAGGICPTRRATCGAEAPIARALGVSTLPWLKAVVLEPIACKRHCGKGSEDKEESLAPYTRFVRIESERVEQVKETLESLREQTRDLRQLIDGGNSVAELGKRAAPTQPRSRSAK